MALPAGITPKTVTIGIASFFDGSLADGTATITAPVNVVHTPTNRPIFSSVMSQKFVDGVAQFTLAPTDAPGLNRVDFSYKLSVTINGALVQPDPIYFTLPAAGPDTVDLDSLVTLPSSAGVPISVDAITYPAGGTDGQALVKSGTSVAWGAGGSNLAVAATVTAAGALVTGKHNPVDASGGAKAMSLPTGAAGGTLLAVEKTDASVNAVNVTGNVRGTAATTISLVWKNESLLLAADISGSWWPVAGHKTKTSLDAAYLAKSLVATGTVAGQLLVWDGAAYSPQTPTAVTPDDIGALSQAAAFVPQPVTVAGWTYVYETAANAFGFPPRVLPPQPNRKRFVVRNRGTTPIWIGYSTGDESNYNKPADALFTVNGVISPGQEWVEGPSEQAVFARPTTASNPVSVSVYVELGA